MDKFLEQLTTFLRNLSLKQRVLLGIGVVLVGSAVGLFVRLTQSADFAVLYSGLAPQDAQSAVASLVSKDIPYQLSTDQTAVSVPSDQLDKARLLLAAEGMPQTGRLGFELFDKTNWAGSDFSEQVNYQRALEGELERTIQTLGNVQAVRVHLVLPHESLFSDQERVAKAAVVMKLRGGTLSDDQVNAVTHLVASAVDNLTPENVTLIGADGRTPLVAHGHEGIQGKDASLELESAMAEKLIATLTPIVGQDHVKASVTVAYDQSSGDTTQETYDPSNPVLVSSQIQEENFGGSPPAGIPGTPSNVPASAPTSGTSNSSQPGANAKPPTGTAQAQANQNNPIVSVSNESEGQRSESKTFAVSKTLRHTIDPAGRVQKIAAAVLVDDAIDQTTDAQGKTQSTHRKRTPDEMKQIEALARAAMGFDASRGDVLSVENVPFVTPPTEEPAPPAITDRVRTVMQNWLWLVRYAVLLLLFGLVYLLILRPVKNQLLSSFRQLAAPSTPALVAAAAGGEAGVSAGMPGGALTPSELDAQLNQTNSQVERVLKMKRHLADRVKNDPIAASQLVRHWMQEREP